MPSINLAPGTQYIIAARKRRVQLYALAIIIVGIFACAWVVLAQYEGSLLNQDEKLQTDISNANAQIEALRDKAVRVSLFEKRLVEIKTLLSTHVQWNPVFDALEKLLPADTLITSIDAASDSPTITIQGVTSNIDQIAVAIASLTRSQPGTIVGTQVPSIFTAGSLKNVQRQEQKTGEQVTSVYTFSMTLTFDVKTLWQ